MRGLSWIALALVGCTFDGNGVGEDDPPDSEPAELDVDGDGVADDDDNCPDVANAGQRDEDGDGVGNACDGCPHVADPDRADGDADGVGDACDPEPTTPGTRIALFEPFDDAARMTDWSSVGNGMWTIEGGALRQENPTPTIYTLYYSAASFGRAAIDTRVTFDGPAGADRGASTLTAFTTAPSFGAGYACRIFTDPAGTDDAGAFQIVTYRGNQPPQIEAELALGANLAEGEGYDLRHVFDGDAGTIACSVAAASLPQTVGDEVSDTTYANGLVALRTEQMLAHFDYVVIYELAAP